MYNSYNAVVVKQRLNTMINSNKKIKDVVIDTTKNRIHVELT